VDGVARSIEPYDWEGRWIDGRRLQVHRRLNDSPRAAAAAAWCAVTLAASALGVEDDWRGPRARCHEEKRHTEPRHRNPFGYCTTIRSKIRVLPQPQSAPSSYFRV